MALTLSTAARNAACNALVDLLDVGSTNAQGRLKIGTAGMASTLATLNMSNPAFGAATAGVATADTISDGTATLGTAAAFQLVDRDETVVITGTVTATGGGGDITFNSVSFTAGGIVTMTSLTITVPAS